MNRQIKNILGLITMSLSITGIQAQEPKTNTSNLFTKFLQKPVTRKEIVLASATGIAGFSAYKLTRNYNILDYVQNNWRTLTGVACVGTGLWYLYQKLYPVPAQTNGYGEQFATILPKNIVTPDSVEQLQEIVHLSGQAQQKISIIGAGKSQGGQVVSSDALMIDLKKLNKVIRLDIENKLVTVQTGITWKQLQEILNPHDLAISAMQSYADFSVGGSLSVSAHGQDFHSGTVSDTVIAFKLITADGKLISVSKTENHELFKLALGGYGLFGIITEVTLALTKDMLLSKEVCTLDASDYVTYFLKNIKTDPTVALHSARLSVSPSALFEQVVVVTYKNIGEKKDQAQLQALAHIKRDQLFFDYLRKYSWVKEIRILIESSFEKPEIVTRNNAMGASIVNIQNGVKNTRDILQQYYVPEDKLELFIAALKKVVTSHQVNLLNATIRYVKKTENIYLQYAPQDCFAIVLFINVPDSSSGYTHAQLWTQELIDEAIKLSGTFYLPYVLFATKEQLVKSYPMFPEFIALKKKYDPQELFTNQLYKKYA